ncbi:MAG: CRISPR-associated protein Cas4 [Candidatus Loosdrechtia sp.]|uniref:CRISPR-associated protein Cas4 n=1 Tax=Candidatus Loosdrechtia sp. TaxID=3101272 RepID=UPI003A68D76C|nr:MAG: CRISPR-associated protein Cas4 [Candidatus Jettenia sp. AMX2]
MHIDHASEPIMVSALEHYSYCPRQCALIHVEQTFDENLYTLRGRAVHEGVDMESSNLKEGVRYERALSIWSERLKLVGKADMVEFHENIPYPVEYKSGRCRAGNHENLQLCAQALCLEEMLEVTVEKGAIFWYASRERKEVVFTGDMRNKVEEVADAARKMITEKLVPPPVNDKRCRDCSLKESCLPEVIHNKTRHHRLFKRLFTVD